MMQSCTFKTKSSEKTSKTAFHLTVSCKTHSKKNLVALVKVPYCMTWRK